MLVHNIHEMIMMTVSFVDWLLWGFEHPQMKKVGYNTSQPIFRVKCKRLHNTIITHCKQCHRILLFLPAARLVNMCCRSNKWGEREHLAFLKPEFMWIFFKTFEPSERLLLVWTVWHFWPVWPLWPILSVGIV